jgi:radical SAM superfamily enzyme YgiQ (UPF0313 family)
MAVDLLLINPNNKVPSPFAAVEPPLWASLIAGYQLSQGKSVRIFDAEAEGLDIKNLMLLTFVLNPKEVMVVVMGNNPSVSSTPKMPIAEELLKYLPEAKITGLHPMAVDYPGVIREPFKGCPNIPWDLLPMDKYRAHNWHCLEDVTNRSPYAVLYTSLNCPFKCSYCNVHTLYGNRKMRYRPMPYILNDLDYFAEKGIRHIKIWDELFCLDNDRVNTICDYIIKMEYDFNVWAYARVDTINQLTLHKMKKAGINWLAYGFESGSDEVRKLSHKGFVESDLHSAIASTRFAGINIMGNFIFGLPGDDIDSMNQSLEMACKENFEFVNFYVGMPYPGSEWYKSLKNPPTDWSRFNQYAPNPYADPKVVKFRDEAFDTYFNRSEYLKMIKHKFGIKAQNHILDMLKWRIR